MEVARSILLIFIIIKLISYLYMWTAHKYLVTLQPLQPDFTKEKLYTDAYHMLFSGTGIHFLNEGNSISRENYQMVIVFLHLILHPTFQQMIIHTGI